MAKLTIELNESDIDELIEELTKQRDKVTELWEDSRRLIHEMEDMVDKMKQIVSPYRTDEE
jgi:vacuolar-type H+-ATPase subunit H